MGAQEALEAEFRFECVWDSVCGHQRGDGLGTGPQSQLFTLIHGRVQKCIPWGVLRIDTSEVTDGTAEKQSPVSQRGTFLTR